MRQCVSSQVAIASEHLAARRALVWFVIGVREQVSLEVAALIETPRADGTLVRRLLHVQDLVHRQRATLAESLAALAAFEGFFLAVNVAAETKINSLVR